MATASIVTVRLENSGSQSLGSGVSVFGQAFKQGDLPAGSGLVASIGGSVVPLQLDVKSTYADGSVKYAVVSVDRPVLAAGAGVDVALSKGVASTGSVVDLAAVSRAHTLTVELTPQDSSTLGGSKVTLDVLDLLRKGLADGSASYWQKGVEATQARVEVDLPGSMHLKFDVTAYKDGQISIDAIFANDEAMAASGGAAKYAVVAKLDGATAINETVSQGQYQNWHREISTGGVDGTTGLGDAQHGWLNIKQDVSYLESTGAVANYDQSIAISSSLLQTYAAAAASGSWDDPLSANGVTQYMPQTGGRADIGITTAPNAAWLMSGDIRAAEYALGQAEAAAAVPWNFWDATHKTWLNTDNYLNVWTDTRGGTGAAGNASSTGLTQQVPTNTGWTPDVAHQPDLSTIPYLMTGERWILDDLESQAAAAIMGTYPASRGGDDGLVVLGGQVRGSAWSLRQIDNAAWLAPDGSAEKAYFQEVSAANWAWLVSKIPEWTAKEGEAFGWVPGDSTAGGAMSPWQQDYFASTAIAAAKRGNADALTFLKWEANFLIGRFTHDAQGFDFHDGAGYLIALGTANPAVDTAYKTWAQIGAATKAQGLSLGDNWSAGNDYVQSALATLAGLYEVLGSAAALDAYNKILASKPFNMDEATLAATPNYAVTIPAAYDAAAPSLGSVSTGSSVVTTTPLPGTITPAPAITTPQSIALGSGADTMVLKISQDFWQVSAQYVITVNGTQIGGAQVAGSEYSSANRDTVTLKGDWGNTVTLAVTFLNDGASGAVGADRNLYVHDVVLNGVDQKWADALYHTGDVVTLKMTNSVATIALPTKVAGQVLTGNSAVNTLAGASGNDIIEGKGGADVLTGGAGADSFIFAAGDGADRITDFASGTDRILFKGVDPASLKASIGTLNGASGLKIAYGTGSDSIFLTGVAGLKAGDLVFSDVPATAPASTAATTTAAITGLLSPAPATTTPQTIALGSGADTLVLKISQDFWKVSAEYVVAINGKQIGGTQFAGALHSTANRDTVTLKGDWGASITLSVTFLNDGSGTKTSEDRNLYLHSVTLNGVDQKWSEGLYHTGDVTGLTMTRSVLALPTPSYALLREGDAAANTLAGGSANDILRGGAGNDVLTGGAGADSFIFAAGDGADRITDFASGIDRIMFKGIDATSLKATLGTFGGVAGLSIAYGTQGDTLFLSGITALKQGDLVFG